eukprot:COSAG06_NODE_594_length_13939_cov_45.080202_2_plen_103_part_00
MFEKRTRTRTRNDGLPRQARDKTHEPKQRINSRHREGSAVSAPNLRSVPHELPLLVPIRGNEVRPDVNEKVQIDQRIKLRQPVQFPRARTRTPSHRYFILFI